MKLTNGDIKYLELLSKQYKTVEKASSELINLMAIQSLPKGTEYFISDIHGEYESFLHILRNASGEIKIKINELFEDTLSNKERKTLATLIYYPEEKLKVIKEQETDMDEFYKLTLNRLITLLRRVTLKYTRDFVQRQMVVSDYSYIIEELIYGGRGEKEREGYMQCIIDGIIDSGEADKFIVHLSELISNISVYHLHIIGDIFDRGVGGDIVMDALMKKRRLDIQWGNHDILWMGAAAGNSACIANVVRICTRYNNLNTLEIGYGISIRQLITFALSVYKNDPCINFKPKSIEKNALYPTDVKALAKINKAITIMQFKLEGQLIKEHEHYEMDSLRLLHKIDYEKGTVDIDGKEYKLNDSNFPTIDPKDPYKLTDEEKVVIEKLKKAFKQSEKLQQHVQFLFNNGGIYKCYNNNLLFHGCVPMEPDGEFTLVKTSTGSARGREWFDYTEKIVRQGYFGEEGDKNTQRGIDFFWYLWCGYNSPLFGKKKITTFERCFINDEETWKEEKNPYYKLIDDENMVKKILREFELDEESSKIVNGHVPVKKGHNPVRANGRVFVIDGGFAKPYQKTTGIAGYTLIYNSYGFILAAHEPFESRDVAVREERDIHSTMVVKEDITTRILNKDVDLGEKLSKKIEDLKRLLYAYRNGIISEK